MKLQTKIIVAHHLVLIVLAPFVSVLMDFQMNIFEEHGLLRAITSLPKDLLPALILLLPLSVLSVPLSIVFHVLIYRMRSAFFWVSAALIVVFPTLGWLFALFGHYVVRYAVFGGLVGGLIAWLTIYRIWRRGMVGATLEA